MDRSLGRTIKSNFAFYETDGLGRDGYISYNNGGFWKDNLKDAINKPRYDFPRFNHFRSLTRFPAPFKYYSDGSGRDTYIIYNEGGLVKGFTPYNSMDLSNYLRSSDPSSYCSPTRGKKIFLSKSEIQTQSLLSKIQRNVVGRLYEKEKKKFVPKLKRKLTMRNYNSYFSPTKNYDPLLRSHSTKNFYKSDGFFKSPKNKFSIFPSVKMNIHIKDKKDNKELSTKLS